MYRFLFFIFPALIPSLCPGEGGSREFLPKCFRVVVFPLCGVLGVLVTWSLISSL